VTHDWRECRPAVARLGDTPKIGQEVVDAVNVSFDELSDADKQAFHRVCCFNSRDENDLAVIDRLSKTIRTRLEP
jgi:hypothetical protein